MLTWIVEHVLADVQHIESKNSRLRVMSIRAKAILKDLLSARHVIKSSDADLVTAEDYTCELKREADYLRKRFDERIAPPL